MRSRSFASRMDAIERARWDRMSSIERAYDLAGRGVSPERWPDDALNAYTGRHCRHLKCLTDAQLDAIYNCANSEVAVALYREWTGLDLPDDDSVDPMRYWVSLPPG